MKKLSGTFTLVALAAIAISSILTFRLFARTPTPTPIPTPTPTPAELKYTLKINGEPLPVKNVHDFKTLLNTMVSGNDHMIHIVYDSTTGLQHEDGPTFENVKTSNVTTSQKAETEGADPQNIGVNVTQRVTTNSSKAFQDVLNSFGSPTPSAIPTATP